MTIGVGRKPSRVQPGLKLPVSNPPFWITPVSHGVTVGVGVGVGAGMNCAQYLPPSCKRLTPPRYPPQTIISLPVHTAVCLHRELGSSVVLVALQASTLGSYRPPVPGVVVPVGVGLNFPVGSADSITVAEGDGCGTAFALAVPLGAANCACCVLLGNPPQTIISLPVHTAVLPVRALGALFVLVAVQLSMPG